MDISEGKIHESPGINAYGSLVAGKLSGEVENIDVTGEVRNFRKIKRSQLSASTQILKPVSVSKKEITFLCCTGGRCYQ